jgi:predicted Zn-dependent peptidase
VVLPPPVADVRRTVLPNGVRVLTDVVPTSLSATVSVWVGVGGRDEPEELAGASHFLEHLLFKGTEQRGALELALEIDAVGGEMNAYTASEYTSYYVRVPAVEADVAMDLLLDVVARPALRPAEFDAEREVILEELAAADDDPEDLAAVRLFETLFPGHPLGR